MKAASIAVFFQLIGAVAFAAAQEGERVPEAAVVSGEPRGMFVGRSLLTGRAVCLLFLSRGRVTRFIPAGGLETFDWARHQSDHARDSGTWEIRDGQLKITWGDGGVHQGPLTVRPDGIEFYGKRYAQPALVDASGLAGRWESARGTAIAGGQGVNATSTLIIEANGRYRLTTTIGGEVAGRAGGGGGEPKTGKLTISGSTITFYGDDGMVAAHTLVPVAGKPIVAFSVDSNMFTRTE